nr:hypothetical protein GCM10025732_19900 [Glycomyces mayteni]
MASLLHVDRDGRPFASALIRRSGLRPADWLRGYLDAYLVPLVHCLYRYGLVFMPHGENIILVLKDGAVERVFLKDIGEECAVLEPATEVPEAIGRIRAEVPDGVRALSILTDVADCFLRFLAGILHIDGVLSEDEFWRIAAEALKDYEKSHPELEAAFARFPLFEDAFPLSCLNRLQLKDNQQMVNIENQEESLIYAGRLDNPLSAWR